MSLGKPWDGDACPSVDVNGRGRCVLCLCLCSQLQTTLRLCFVGFPHTLVKWELWDRAFGSVTDSRVSWLRLFLGAWNGSDLAPRRLQLALRFRAWWVRPVPSSQNVYSGTREKDNNEHTSHKRETAIQERKSESRHVDWQSRFDCAFVLLSTSLLGCAWLAYGRPHAV